MPLAQPLSVVPLFNPFDTAGMPRPTHGMWADDPAWTKPADGAAVSSWRNRSGGGDPAQATGSLQPLYFASVAGLNRRGALLFDGADDYLDVDITDIAQPFQIVTVFKASSVVAATNAKLIGRGSTQITQGFGYNATGVWVQNWGAALTGGAADTNTHVRRDVANGASSSYDIDGVQNAAGNTSSGAPVRLTVGAGNDGAARGHWWPGYIAFVGIYPSAADLTALIVGLRGYYGTA